MSLTLTQKINTVHALTGAGWQIRAEARIAEESLRIEMERHEQAVRDIAERFQLEAWQHVERNWAPEELPVCV